jgi:hypothetical protein
MSSNPPLSKLRFSSGCDMFFDCICAMERS